ncbi:MAG: HDIG domain-containing protein [Alphaproteobacteria bacterium]|uniref:HDIG domain-containing protein n=1 Tax=Candidatus Nitrobium versatile TaxID=2884831 RepID=A0A953J9T8_9BACT|nr:HDIG domain-containing protein [Candidatus Nitrobium versatile]
MRTARHYEDVELLRKAGVSEEDIAHCVKVGEKALEIAERTGADVNRELVGRGALLHDLGKARTHAIEHGRIGAEMGRSLGLPKEITDIMEKHIRGGLTKEEARELGLPAEDYRLKSLEERIVIYADRLVDIITDGIVSLGSDEREAERKFEEILRNIPKYGKDEKTLDRYLGYHREIQGLIRRGEEEDKSRDAAWAK